MSLNKVMLIGNCGRDPEIRHLDTGSVMANFSLATTERYKDRSGDIKEMTEWHNIICWRGLAEIAEKYVRKGTQLYVEGRLRTRSYSDKDGNLRYTTEIVADTFQMLGRKSDNQGIAPVSVSYPQPQQPQRPAAQPSQNWGQSAASVQPQSNGAQQILDNAPEEDDDLPF